ncbi:MAG: hypothetical protein IPL97_12440 [Niastella sp.]|nr:hypothetical protein [Niastella sp.]
MYKTVKIILSFIVLLGLMKTGYADRGVGKKKTRIIINFPKSNNAGKALNFNLKGGLTYNGSFALTSKGNTINTQSQQTLITYQQGNTVFIVPYKQKVITTEIKPGYTGMKLIIQRN